MGRYKTIVYNKLFAKIVRSSIWLEPTPTRLVWFMFIALMDEDGYVQFASPANVAHTARITGDEADEAIRILESPDANSADDNNAGRRIERVPGGWLILNAGKYRDLVTKDMIRQQTRERVARHRAKEKAQKTECNADVTHGNEEVTQSVSISEETRVHGNSSNWLTRDSLWIDLQRFLPEKEVKANVGLWIHRIKENPRALYEAIADFKDKRNKRVIKNVAAWITQRYVCFSKLKKVVDNPQDVAINANP